MTSKSKKPLFEKNTSCKNCGSENISNYCSNCGQKVYTKRFTLGAFLNVFLDAFNIEKGFFHTVILLFIKPGVVINEYIHGKTKSYFNPLKYIIIVGGIFAFVMIKTNIIDTNYDKGNDLIFNSSEQFQQSYEEYKKDQEAVQANENFLAEFKNYMHLVPIVVIPFFSLISLWFYRSRNLFYGEFLIMNSYIFAQTFIITIILLIPLAYLIPVIFNYFPLVSAFTTFAYLAFVLKKTFQESPLRSVIKAFFIYLFGMILFFIFIAVLSILAGIVMKLLGFSLKDVFL